jgi:hypothetical protein
MVSTSTIERPVSREDERRARTDRVRFIEIPSHRFVMVDGEGPPAEEAFAARFPALYGFAYGLRFALKARGIDHKVGPSEGLWWTTDGLTDLSAIFSLGDKRTWRWILMIALPDEPTDEELEERLADARLRVTPTIGASLRVERFDEGEVAQVMHIGPYSGERPTIERLHRAIAEAGLRPSGRHHELYLGDPRRAAPDKLRTLLRMPVGALNRADRRPTGP